MSEGHATVCALCGGDRVEGTTTYSVDLGFGVVVVRHVPALVCEQCGEDWISDTTAARLEEVTDSARPNRHFVEVLPY